MRNAEKDAREMGERRQKMLETAFRLFTERSIDTVTITEIARESGCGKRTVNRYFSSKPVLAVAVATWALEDFMVLNRQRRKDPASTSAAEDYEFFLDSFLELYRCHRDILRFNQLFNVYVQSEQITAKQLRPFQAMISNVRENFRAIYTKGERDGTLTTEVPEETMFSATIHLMLAVVTRYAVGLVYDAGVDPEEELLLQKRMLLREYAKQ